MYKNLLIHILLTLLVLVVMGPVDASAEVSIDKNRITVSGVSSGAHMAHQLHIAYSDVFSGAGMVAGGPYGCADGSLSVAMTRCMAKVDSKLPIAQWVENIRSAVTTGKVGETSALDDDRVWIFHGMLDHTVAAELSAATVALYAEFLPTENIRYVHDVEAAHHFPTQNHGNACTLTQAPFIGDCDFDAAGELLQYLYGDLKAPEHETQAALLETTLPAATSAGLSESAYLYIPPACKDDGQACKAHLVLHGCAQSSIQIGTEFIQQSGYLPWAAANNIVLAFPQVLPATMNPFACWDWWGYTGTAYRWRDGAQMKVLSDWMRGLAVP